MRSKGEASNEDEFAERLSISFFDLEPIFFSSTAFQICSTNLEISRKTAIKGRIWISRLKRACNSNVEDLVRSGS